MTLRGDILKNIVAVVLALTIALPISFSSGLTAFADESSSEETSVSDESSAEESSETVSDEASGESSTESSTAATNYTIPSASSDFYVYDEMNTISDSTRQSIVQTGEYLNAQYGAQIVVAVFNTLGDYNIESFTNELLTSWNVGGDAGYGLVFLMDVSEDDYYCISGAGLKQLYTSSKIQTILDDNIESVFAQKDYDAAALAFVNACTSDLEKYMQDLAASGVVLVKNSNTTTTASTSDSADAQATDTESQAATTTKSSGGFLGFLKVLVIIILVLVVLLCVLFVLAYLHGQKVKRERAEARRRNAQRRGNSSSAPRSTQRSSSSSSASRGNTSSSRQRPSGGTRSGTTVNRTRSSSSSRSDYRNRYDR